VPENSVSGTGEPILGLYTAGEIVRDRFITIMSGGTD
jgi:hypothetical protein